MPDFLVALIVHKVLVEICIIELTPFCGCPCWEVYTIGYITYVILLWEVTLPDIREHLLAYPTVELTYTVNLLTSVASEGREAETLVVIVCILTAHTDELVPRNAEALWITTHVLAEESLVEVVVTCWYWSVNSIERRSANQLKSLVEVQAILLDVIAKALQVAESCMTLVAMINLLLDTKFLQSQDTTDTQQNLLLQTVLPVTTIERVSDRTVELRVNIIICIQEIQLDTTYVHLPYISMNLIVCIRYINYNRVAILIQNTLQRKRVEVLCIIIGNLLTIHAQRLLEVTISVEETNSTHIHVAVRSLLQVVTGKHTQTTRVDLNHLVDTILHTEVSYRRTLGVRFYIHIITEHLIYLLYLGHCLLILDNSFLAVIAQTLQKQYRVGIHLLVKFWIEALEQVTTLIVPCPPHIVSDFIQAFQLLWET